MKSVLHFGATNSHTLLGSIIILVLGLKEVGGWEKMLEITGATSVNAYGDTMNNLIRSNSDPDFPWLGALVGSAIIGFGIGVPTSTLYSVCYRVGIKSNPGEVRFLALI